MLYGGEGHELIDGTSTQGPAVYLLHISSLTWRRQETHSSSPGHSPGVRSLHIATVQCLAESSSIHAWRLITWCQTHACTS